MTAPTIGIDLGTTNSCAGVYLNDRVEIILNDVGSHITPSWVSFTDNDRLIGECAKTQAASNPENTVFGIKRIIGRRFSDIEVQEQIKHWPFKVIADANDRPIIEVTYKGQEKHFTPEEISSLVLMKIKQSAEDYLGKRVTNAVITCPAYFNDAQRQATKAAGEICGLNVLRIVNEPTAACIAYGFNKDDQGNDMKGEKNIIVFDFGGGSLNVSLLNIDEGIFEVRATTSDQHLGGDDLDNRMAEYLVSEFKQKYNKDISGNARAMHRLRTKCERAKRELSRSFSAAIEVEALCDGIDFFTSISRAKFENLCMDIFKRTLEPIDKVLNDAKMSKKDIDKIFLIGGSSRIPKIQQLIQEYFNGKKPLMTINPDEAVARGAAVQANILDPAVQDRYQWANNLIDDMCVLSIGIETNEHDMSIIMPRNTLIPACKTEVFTTQTNNQQSIAIRIYEGQRPLTKDNHLLGEFVLDGIPPLSYGVPKIEITLRISIDDILTVTAQDLSNLQNKKSMQIDLQPNRLTCKEIERMVREAEQFKLNDDDIRKQQKIQIDTLKLELTKYDLGYFVAVTQNRIKQWEQWMESNRTSIISQYTEKELEDYFKMDMKICYQWWDDRRQIGKMLKQPQHYLFLDGPICKSSVSELHQIINSHTADGCKDMD